MSDVRRFSATYASDRGWVIGRVPLMMGNTQFVLASDYDKQEAELESLRGSLDEWKADYKAIESELTQLRTERDLLNEELAQCGGFDSFAELEDYLAALTQREGGEVERV